MIRMSKDEEMGKNERNNVPEGSRVEIRPFVMDLGLTRIKARVEVEIPRTGIEG